MNAAGNVQLPAGSRALRASLSFTWDMQKWGILSLKQNPAAWGDTFLSLLPSLLSSGAAKTRHSRALPTTSPPWIALFVRFTQLPLLWSFGLALLLGTCLGLSFVRDLLAMANNPVAVEGLAGLQGALLACPGKPGWGQQGTASLGTARPLRQAPAHRGTTPGPRFYSMSIFPIVSPAPEPPSSFAAGEK